MTTLPLVQEIYWERVAHDFDDVGPEACMAEIVDELLAHNPHYLEMACRCAMDAGAEAKILTGFAMFYRILALDAADRGRLLPRITPDTRDIIGALVTEFGEKAFTLLAIESLCEENPCLAQMAEGFASRQEHYLPVMQGFAMLYKCLSAQAVTDGVIALSGAGGA